MTFKNNRAPLLSIIKLYASFHHHMWIQTGVTVRKRLSWVLTSVTLTFDLWPWPFAWTSLLSLVITPENFMMIQWWEHSQKGVTDRQTDRQTDRRTEKTIHRAAWSQLKIKVKGTPVSAASSWLISVVLHIRASYQLRSLSFHDNWAYHSRDTIWLWKFKVKVKGQGQKYPSQHSIQLTHFLFHINCTNYS